VHVEGVGMTFRTKRGPYVAITNVDLSVQKGEFIALIYIGLVGFFLDRLVALVATIVTHGTVRN